MEVKITKTKTLFASGDIIIAVSNGVNWVVSQQVVTIPDRAKPIENIGQFQLTGIILVNRSNAYLRIELRSDTTTAYLYIWRKPSADLIDYAVIDENSCLASGQL